MTEARGTHWRTLLAPYDVTYVGHLYHAVDDEGDSCVDANNVLWFRWTPTAASASATRDALELLALLATLCARDVTAFEDALGELDDAFTQYFLAHRARYERGYTMGVYVRVDDDEMLAVVEGLLRGNDRVSQTYETARRALLEGSDGNSDSDIHRVPLWIEFESRGVVPKKAIATSLALVEQLNGRARDQDGACHVTELFHISAIQLDVYERVELDVASMAQLATLLDAGVRLPSFRCGNAFHVARTADVLVQTVRTIHALLGPRCIKDAEANDTASTTQYPRVHHFEVSAPVAMALAVPLFTALAHSQTLRSLEVDFNLMRPMYRQMFPMDRCCRWLAYALFSRDATHAIEKLEVTAEFLHDFNAATIREVHAHEDPLLTLIDPQSRIDSPANDTVVDIPSGTEIALVYDYTRARKDIATFSTTTALTALRVLQDDQGDGWVSFVQPGWGECRVRRELVTVRQQPACTSMNATASRGIPHVRIDYISSEDIEAVSAFLDVVGLHVRRLDLHEFDSEVDDVANHIVSFVQRCPHLETLDLFAVELETIQPLVDAFRNQDCFIQRLKFRQLRVHGMASMHAFFDALADPSHAMTACLRELSFHVFEQTIHDAARGSILFSCAEMLPKNSILQICRAITLSKKRCTQFASLFQACDSIPLPARKRPLALRSKLAFLSVVMGSRLAPVQERSDAGVLQYLDTNVVQTIFRLAAENEVRQSGVEVPVRQW